LPQNLTDNKKRLSRFKQEARATSTLNHPNILTIHEISQEGSLHFIATEFIDGVTLRQQMKSTRLKIAEVLEMSIQIAGALAAAHAAGIVHRDLKPENIMVRRDGYLKVLDFGLAKLTEPHTASLEASTLVQTDPGVVVGTAQYLSPEQARGLEVDARSDIFSLGVVLYEMVASRAPFEGTTKSEIVAAILEREPLANTSRRSISPSSTRVWETRNRLSPPLKRRIRNAAPGSCGSKLTPASTLYAPTRDSQIYCDA
jgi:serine/threonine protein kinase